MKQSLLLLTALIILNYCEHCVFYEGQIVKFRTGAKIKKRITGAGASSAAVSQNPNPKFYGSRRILSYNRTLPVDIAVHGVVLLLLLKSDGMNSLCDSTRGLRESLSSVVRYDWLTALSARWVFMPLDRLDRSCK